MKNNIIALIAALGGVETVRLTDGIAVGVDDVITDDPLAHKLMAAVQEGALLKLDAVQGLALAERIGAPAFESGAGDSIDLEGWYGTIPAIGVAVGPFDRKSQAMNAIVLALVGLSPKGVRAAKEERPAPAAAEEPRFVDTPFGRGEVLSDTPGGLIVGFPRDRSKLN